MLWALAIAAFIILNMAVVGAVIFGVTAPLREFGKRFAPQPPVPDAVRRNFQSFSFGATNAGGSIHIAVDDRFLHLYPAWIMRLFRTPAMSIPWDKIQVLSRGARHTKVRIAGEKMEIKGPTWCLELAAPS